MTTILFVVALLCCFVLGWAFGYMYNDSRSYREGYAWGESDTFTAQRLQREHEEAELKRLYERV